MNSLQSIQYLNDQAAKNVSLKEQIGSAPVVAKYVGSDPLSGDEDFTPGFRPYANGFRLSNETFKTITEAESHGAYVIQTLQ